MRPVTKCQISPPNEEQKVFICVDDQCIEKGLKVLNILIIACFFILTLHQRQLVEID